MMMASTARYPPRLGAGALSPSSMRGVLQVSGLTGAIANAGQSEAEYVDAGS